MTERTGPTRRAALAMALGGAALLPVPAAASDLLDFLFGNLTRSPGDTGALPEGDVVAGLREALSLATNRTVDRVGQPGGYLSDRAIHIPLPGLLAQTQSVLKPLGRSALLDDLEVRLNRAAETAAPAAEAIFLDAIRGMTISDGLGILRGPDDAATRYFQRRMSPPLVTAFRPIVSGELEDAGAFGALERFVAGTEARALAPAVGDYARDDLTEHGLDFALKGLFHYLAKEEAAIRNDPVARTSDLLRRVFG
ncbi:MAG: DUF4197 domain-containing protein [Alphaproteobacteria bacterium]|nr:DUF4197 domain-containing protein [Alphaproteobacteria bacterium]